MPMYPARTIARRKGPHSFKKSRSTIDVFHTASFGIVGVFDAFDLHDLTSLWALLGAMAPASPPGTTCALLLSALTVLLQLCARPASALPPPAPINLPQKIH